LSTLSVTPELAKRPRGRPRKLPGTEAEGNRRQDLMRVAARLFRQRGFEAVTTRDIAAAAGMHSGSPFYHFETKGVLLFAIIQAGMQAAIASQDRLVFLAPESPVAQLRALIRHHYEVLLGPDSDFIPVMLYEWRSLSEAQQSAITQLRQAYEAPWAPVLQTLAAQGALRADPGVARLMILGALNWSVQWFDPQGPASLSTLTDQALSLFLQTQ
jgi:TetR/AcrR family transcriptional regulator, cholesterol catabolism regulator